MANYKVTDTELTSVANAIRTKGGTQAQLEFPTGFVTAIENIPTGVTPTGDISITENGTVDVTNYARAIVNVSGSGLEAIEPTARMLTASSIKSSTWYTESGSGNNVIEIYEIDVSKVYTYILGQTTEIIRAALSDVDPRTITAATYNMSNVTNSGNPSSYSPYKVAPYSNKKWLVCMLSQTAASIRGYLYDVTGLTGVYSSD